MINILIFLRTCELRLRKLIYYIITITSGIYLALVYMVDRIDKYL